MEVMDVIATSEGRSVAARTHDASVPITVPSSRDRFVTSPVSPVGTPLSQPGSRRMDSLGQSHAAQSDLGSTLHQEPIPSQQDFAAEEASHVDVAGDLLGIRSMALHTWHGRAASEEWQAVMHARRDRSHFGNMESDSVHNARHQLRNQTSSNQFLWLPSRPHSPEAADPDVASTVDVADDLLGTSRGAQYRETLQHESRGVPAPNYSRSSATSHGRLPELGGASLRWGGHTAAAAPPPRSTLPLASLFTNPDDDDEDEDEDEDDMSADEADASFTDGDGEYDAEEMWLDALAARQRPGLRGDELAGQEYRHEHTWHGNDAELTQHWARLLHARQSMAAASFQRTSDAMSNRSLPRRSPSPPMPCGR